MTQFCNSPYGRGGDRLGRFRVRGWQWLATLAACTLLATVMVAYTPPLGEFTDQIDIGGPLIHGATLYDAANGEYHIFGGGANVWMDKDAFHFVWKRLSGDMTLTAHIVYPYNDGPWDRKAALMVRQDLGPSAPYADVVVHAGGPTNLQYRLAEDGQTAFAKNDVKTAPELVRLVRKGNTFTLYVSPSGGPMQAAGSMDVPLKDPLYVGLAVCAHNESKLTEADFSKLSILEGKAEP